MKEVDFSSSTKTGKNTASSKNGVEAKTPCFYEGVIPYRPTPKWVTDKQLVLQRKRDFIQVALGKAPIGILPKKALLPSEDHRLAILQELQNIKAAKYDNTDSEQRVESWGKPFVDSTTLDIHLTMQVNEKILGISNPLVERTQRFLESLGYEVDFLIDPVTGLQYHAGVFRQISVSKSSSVLHVDDFIRDGQHKLDFRLPKVLTGRMYYQVSFNLLLDDGGYEPDSLYVYNCFYNPSDEAFCMENGWQFPVELMGNASVFRYTPKIGEAYVFSTTAFHDICGGSPLSNRITWSVFAIYVPSLNLMLLYN